VHVLADGQLRDLVTEQGQFRLDAPPAPRWILPRHASDQVAQLGVERWATDAAGSGPPPPVELATGLAMDAASQVQAREVDGVFDPDSRNARFSSAMERWVLIPRSRPIRMRVSMPAIIDQAGRPFNVDEADGIN
jgi:hypothetical protein